MSMTSSDNERKIYLLTYAGLPVAENQTSAKFDILYNEAFITGYSDEYKNPLWTVYRWGNMQGEYNSNIDSKWERTRGFKIDPRTQAKIQHEDYEKPYDRGHMCPNSALNIQYGHMAQLESYLMSNICPQKDDFNRGIWMHLEGYIRETLSQDDTKNKEIQDVYVITGPVFGENPKKMSSGVPIPDAFYKILTYKRGYFGTMKAVCFMFPHHQEWDRKDKNFLKYAVTIDEVEKATGLNFFSDLSETKQKNLESIKRNFEFEDI